VGVGFAFACTRLILRLAFHDQHVAISAMPSLPVLAFTFGASLLTGILFGVAPAWMMAHVDPADALRGAHRSTAHGAGWTQKSLVVTQAALSLVLLCAAGLLTRSLSNMQGQKFGFEVANRYILHLDPSMAGYTQERLPALYRQLRDNLAAIPGVNRVSFGLYTPMEGNNWGETIYIEGQAPPPAGSSQNQTSWLRVTDGYFESIGTKIVKGRTITEQDTASTRKIAVVNQTFARHFFKDEDPIGKHFGDLDQKYAGSFEIVGVTEDTQYRDATRKIPPMFFLPEAQNVVYDDPRFKAFEDSNHFLNTAVLQVQGPVPGLEPQVRRAFAQVSPDLPVIDFMSFSAQVDGNFAQNQMLAKLTSLFGLLALVLASVGLYGVTAYSVERRTSEIGIRMALGAERSDITRMILRRSLLLVTVGVSLGVVGALAVTRVLAKFLFEVTPTDLPTFLGVAALLVAVALLSGLVPARRATRVDPLIALRWQ
jgi:predicted permease